MGAYNGKPVMADPDGQGIAKMMNWPRRFLAIQTAVSAAGDDLDRVLDIVLNHSLRIIPAAEGGEIELRDGPDFVCRCVLGATAKNLGQRNRATGIVPGFGLSSLQGRDDLRSSINAPIAFEGDHIGVLRLHSRMMGAFNNRDLLALQLLAGLIAQGLARYAHARGEMARAEADKRFKATFEQAAVGIAHVSPEGRFILVNDKFCEIAGHERDELIKRGFEGITHPDDLDADLANVADLLSGQIPSYSMEKRYIRGNGTIAWINLTVSLIHKPDGSPDFFVSVIEDISARRTAELDAERDPLTGLLNRRGVLKQLEYVLRREGAWQQGIAATFIDLDNFKRVNDRFGHSEGDRCLTKVAGALRKALRSEDVVARLGGDEFLALFPAASDDLVKDVLERLQKEIAAISNTEPWIVGASFGVAIVPAGTAIDPAMVIGSADKLMYQAKQAKGNGPLVATIPIAA